MGHNAEGVLPKTKNWEQVKKWWHYLLVVCKAEICKSKAGKVQEGHSCREWKGRAEYMGAGGCYFQKPAQETGNYLKVPAITTQCRALQSGPD